jgi:hypothetical protein
MIGKNIKGPKCPHNPIPGPLCLDLSKVAHPLPQEQAAHPLSQVTQ